MFTVQQLKLTRTVEWVGSIILKALKGKCNLDFKAPETHTRDLNENFHAGFILSSENHVGQSSFFKTSKSGAENGFKSPGIVDGITYHFLPCTIGGGGGGGEM